MKFLKKKGLTKEAIKEFNESRSQLEVDLLDEMAKSKKLAWMVTGAFFIITVAALGNSTYVNYKYSQPLPPFLLKLGPNEHDITPLKMTTDKASYGDEIDQYFLTQYVIHRESYDFWSLQADYDAVGLMSSPNVADGYLAKFKGKQKIDDVLGDSETTRVVINSTIVDREHSVATIRFTTIRRARSNNFDDPPKHWIAILGYEYKSLTMNASQRYINPLGFRVLSYRVTPESN